MTGYPPSYIVRADRGVRETHKLLACWSSNRYDGTNQDCVNNSATVFTQIPCGFLLPWPTLKDHGYIQIRVAGRMICASAPTTATVRCGLLRDGVSGEGGDTSGGTRFDGGVWHSALGTGSLSVGTGAFVLDMNIVPVHDEAGTGHFVCFQTHMMTHQIDGAMIAVSDGGLTIGLPGTATPAATLLTPYADHTIVPLIKVANANITLDVRSAYVMHHAPRGI